MNAYVIYTITTKDKNGDNLSAIRRYSDFDWLHDILKMEYKHLIIPPLPEKAIFDRFSPEFVEYRRKELERFLKRTLAHPEISQATALRIFLTANEATMDLERSKPKVEPPPPVSQKKADHGFFAAFTATISAAVTGPAVELKEIDPFFDSQKAYLANLDQQLQVLVARSNANTKKKTRTGGDFIRFCAFGFFGCGF